MLDVGIGIELEEERPDVVVVVEGLGRTSCFGRVGHFFDPDLARPLMKRPFAIFEVD